MSKTAIIHTRIQPSIKLQVEDVLYKLGISISEAISIYFNQIAMQKGLPFDVKIPNKKTRKAISDMKAGKNSKKFKSISGLMKDLEC